jgi:hypothetical protein
MSAEEICSFFEKSRDSLEMSIETKKMFGMTSKYNSLRPKAISQSGN